jgi:hypothetical protein
MYRITKIPQKYAEFALKVSGFPRCKDVLFCHIRRTLYGPPLPAAVRQQEGLHSPNVNDGSRRGFKSVRRETHVWKRGDKHHADTGAARYITA